MEEKETIKNIITCGVSWGNGAPPFTQLSLDNNIAILGIGNKNIKTFRNANMETLIALKDGHSIVALGKFQEHISTLTWRDVITNHMVKDESLGEKYNEEGIQKLATEFWFNLEDKVDIIKVDTWIILDPHIYYPMRMSTVSIKQKYVIKECNDRFEQKQLDTEQYNKQYNKQLAQFNIQKAQGLFNTLNSEDIKDDEKRTLLENALEFIKKAQELDPTNTEVLNLKNAIESNPVFKKEQIKEKKKTIWNIYTISWILAGIGLLILIANRLGLYALTVNRLILMAGILVLIFIPFITSLKLGIFDISFEKEKNK